MSLLIPLKECKGTMNVSFCGCCPDHLMFFKFFLPGFGDMYPALDGLFFAYLIAGLSLVFMNIIMVKNFIDHILLILQRELRLI